MPSANPVLPETRFAAERLLPPRQAIVAFLGRVAIAPPAVERVALDAALGRVLAETIVADGDYPDAPRSGMDGFAIDSKGAPGTFEIVAEVRMGSAAGRLLAPGSASRIPTGGILPAGADAVVPFEEARVAGDAVAVGAAVASGENVIERGADMRRGDAVVRAGRVVRAGEIGVLATLGATFVPVYRRPRVALFSSGDELVEPGLRPKPGQIRDSNRYAVAASLRAMGAEVVQHPTLRDEEREFEAALTRAIAECDAVVVTGGSSVGARDRLPHAVAAIADPGIVVHGLRVKPGKPTLFGAGGSRPIVGLPGNPTSALLMLEAVAAPIFGALRGAPITVSQVPARLAEPARSRLEWTWFVPVWLEDDGGLPAAHPLPLRSFSVSLPARADGYIVMEEGDEEWPAGRLVTVHRFLGG